MANKKKRSRHPPQKKALRQVLLFIIRSFCIVAIAIVERETENLGSTATQSIKQITRFYTESNPPGRSLFLRATYRVPRPFLIRLPASMTNCSNFRQLSVATFHRRSADKLLPNLRRNGFDSFPLAHHIIHCRAQGSRRGKFLAEAHRGRPENPRGFSRPHFDSALKEGEKHGGGEQRIARHS